MKKSLFIIAAAAAILVGCKHDEPVDPAGGALEITALEITSGETLAVPGELVYNITISDKVDLSTLKVTAALESGVVLATQDTRTPGQTADLKDQKLAVAFCAGMKQGADIIVTFEATNVDGQSVKQVKKVAIQRPALPETLYLTIGDAHYAMAQSLENAAVYTTEDGDFESITTAFVSTSEDPSESDFLWGDSGATNVGAVVAFGAAGIAVSYPTILVSSYSFNAESFEIVANGEELNVKVNGTSLEPASGLLYANVAFTKDAETEISGVANLEGAYNRDFFSYEGGKLTFLRESGNYDVYYSPKYNYFWVVKENANYPEAYWIVGTGFTHASEWHEDFNHNGWWAVDNTIDLGYVGKIADHLYQATLYLNNTHEWGLEFETYKERYSDNHDGAENGFCINEIKGDVLGLQVSNAKSGINGLVPTADFAAGYYTLLFDESDMSVTLTRHTAWPEIVDLGLTMAGQEFEAHADFSIIRSIHLEKGQEVAFAGFTTMEHAYNRDFFAYENGKLTFLRESGDYTIEYWNAYDYMWVYNWDAATPDCIYLWGNGRVSTPEWNEALGYEAGNSFNAYAPYFTVAPKIADHKYQATMSVSNYNSWWDIRIVAFKDVAYGQNVLPIMNADIVTGDAAGIFYINGAGTIDGNWGASVYSDDNGGNTQGTYRFIYTLSEDDSEIVGVEINAY